MRLSSTGLKWFGLEYLAATTRIVAATPPGKAAAAYSGEGPIYVRGSIEGVVARLPPDGESKKMRPAGRGKVIFVPRDELLRITI